MCDSLSSYPISIMLYIENACALPKCSYCRLFDEQIKILLMYVLVQYLHKGEIKNMYICIGLSRGNLPSTNPQKNQGPLLGYY